MSVLNQLETERQNLGEKLKSMARDLGGKRWTNEDQQKFARVSGAFDEVSRKTNELVCRHQELERLEERRSVRAEQRAKERHDAFIGWVRTGDRSECLEVKRADDLEALTRFDLNSGNTILLRAPSSLGEPMRDETDIRLMYRRAEERVEMGAGVPTAGQELVPDEAMQDVDVALVDSSPIRQHATVVRTTNAGDMPAPISDDSAEMGEIIDENSSSNESVVTTREVMLGAYQYSSKVVRVHERLLGDPTANAEQIVLDAIVDRVARAQNRHFVLGDGVNKPRGILTDAANTGITTASPVGISFDEIVDIEGFLNPNYRTNAKWLFNTRTTAMVRKIVDNAGQPVWGQSLVPGTPDQLLGHDIVEANDMPFGASSKGIVIGDLSKFVIRDWSVMTIRRLVELYATNNQVGFLAWMFTDAATVGSNSPTVAPIVYASMGA